MSAVPDTDTRDHEGTADSSKVPSSQGWSVHKSREANDCFDGTKLETNGEPTRPSS